jgi:hypothetical protein
MYVGWVEQGHFVSLQVPIFVIEDLLLLKHSMQDGEFAEYTYSATNEFRRTSAEHLIKL